MSTLKVTNIQDTSGGNSLTTEQLYNGAAKAWVNFNGTGTTSTNQTIRASFNVSSVYKNGTGDYTVNFTTALVDANYTVASAGSASSGGGSPTPLVPYGQTAPTSNAVRLLSWYMTATSGQSASDVIYGNVAIFR